MSDEQTPDELILDVLEDLKEVLDGDFYGRIPINDETVENLIKFQKERLNK